MEVLKKLQKARKAIKETKTKKQGRNTFSKYDYFTPDQVSKLVYDIEQKLNLFHKFDLISDDNHIYGILTIYDLDTTESIEFKMLTDIPIIKATNSTQQLGGAMTYTNRYLLMNTYDIQDNNLDFDTDKKEDEKTTTEKEDKKNELPWLNTNTEGWNNAVTKLKDGVITIEEIEKYYIISKANKKTLTELKN